MWQTWTEQQYLLFSDERKQNENKGRPSIFCYLETSMLFSEIQDMCLHTVPHVTSENNQGNGGKLKDTRTHTHIRLISILATFVSPLFEAKHYRLLKTFYNQDGMESINLCN